ncbi:hypothetical protein WDV06_08985 [Streptomyces racemochromogenes]|uniref:Uncharacterized protein n=1 Tax=Streptomyces racemochromogenes TaxID=67353 RepID=A0ABW7PB50_9ACTN
MEEAWGIDVLLLESLFRLATQAPVEQSEQAYRQGVAELLAASLFSSEVDPDTTQLIRLEVIDNLLTFGNFLDNPDSDEIERMAEASSGLASYLDGLVEGSLHPHPSEQSHRRYLARLVGSARGRSYFAARHSAVESACLRALQALPAPEDGLTALPVARCWRCARSSARNSSRLCAGCAERATDGHVLSRMAIPAVITVPRKGGNRQPL